MLHAVIMAGGAGTRFWPASRVALPKQLLPLAGERTMIQATVDRLRGLVAPQQVLVVTNERYVAPIREQLPELPAAGVLGEPCKRDTAPCIGLAAALIGRTDPEAVMVVCPADHVIQPDDAFRRALTHAVALVEAQPQRFVTLGIRPTYPAESFGYIQRGARLTAEPALGKSAAGEPAVYAVKKFREKPAAETARAYLESGDFYWNSGIFVWRAAAILAALERHAASIHAQVMRIAEAAERDDFPQVLQREFAAIEGRSIDYAVMEHYDDVAVVEAPFQWDDVGGWNALARLHPADSAGNVSVGRHLNLESADCLVRSQGEHLIVTVGLKDCIVVHTPDATLVADRGQEETLRKVVQELQERGWEKYV